MTLIHLMNIYIKRDGVWFFKYYRQAWDTYRQVAVVHIMHYSYSVKSENYSFVNIIVNMSLKKVWTFVNLLPEFDYKIIGK